MANRPYYWTVLAGICWIGVLAFLSPSFLLQPAQGLIQASTIYVVPTGSDVAGCGSISSPCRSIQYAVNRAASGDTILVAAGTYTYSQRDDPCPFLRTRAVVCFVDKQLTILGGYSSTNWAIRDPISNPTVIDGQNTYRGVVIVSYNSIASLRMEGFTIRNGLAQGASSGSDWDTTAFGGGMWAQNSAVTLKDMVFENNVARGGGNASSSYGGAASGGGLAIQSPRGGLVSVLERVTFRDNKAVGGIGADRGGLALGGGLFTYQAVVSGNALTFTNNLAQAGDSNGSGIAGGLNADALGGGSAFQQGSRITLSNVRATGNRAVGGKAGTYSGTVGGGGFGGGFHSEEATFSLTDAWIEGNQVQGGSGATGGVGFGGGLELLNSNVTLERIWVIGNVASSGGASIQDGYAGSPGGGGAYLWSFRDPPHSGKITNVVFADNLIKMSPLGRSDRGGGGGGLTVQGMRVDVTHCTFAQNRFEGPLKSGQAILVQGTKGSEGIPGVVYIYYSIIANHVNTYTSNTSALTVAAGSTANLYKSLFAGNTNDTNINGRPLPPGFITGLDTVLITSSVGFLSPGPPNYDYHIASNSPAVGQAIGSTTANDVDRQPRPYGEVADIGADEYMPPVLTVTPQEVVVLVDAPTTRQVFVDVKYTNNVVRWEATTSATWLFLGPSGSEKTASGQSGEWLQLWFNPEGLDLGRYETDVLLTSPDADPVTLRVSMIKVAEVFSTYLPLIFRQR